MKSNSFSASGDCFDKNRGARDGVGGAGRANIEMERAAKRSVF